MNANESLVTVTPEVSKLVASLPASPSDFCRESHFADWQSERINEGGMYRLGTSRSERFGRCHDAAEDGADGSTHAEHIQDFRDYGFELFDAARSELWRMDLSFDDNLAAEQAIELREGAFDKACNELESWHQANGSLEQQVG